jgi:hypothetical protein
VDVGFNYGNWAKTFRYFVKCQVLILAGLDQHFISHYCLVLREPVGLCIGEQYIASNKKICANKPHLF